jgi:pseudouridine-5'-phosphate glycosidase
MPNPVKQLPGTEGKAKPGSKASLEMPKTLNTAETQPPKVGFSLFDQSAFFHRLSALNFPPLQSTKTL